MYCDGEPSNQSDQFIHKPDCPVVLAREAVERAKEVDND
jgi:hypothetical protein